MSNETSTLARSRIESLLDAKSFVEIGAAVRARSTDFNMSQKKAPSDGVITGYGTIEGYPVFIYSQDCCVMGGTVGEMHSEKIVRLYDLAVKTGSPIVGLVDCAGMRLEEATDALSAFGNIYMAQSNASGVVPQITAVFGNCGGGMAILAALSDFVLMESENARLFVNSPNALFGNHISSCDTSGALFQSEEAGLVDFAGSESQVLSEIKNLVSLLPANNEDDMSYRDCGDDPNRLCPGLLDVSGDPLLFASEISDNHKVFETKSGYAKDMVTALISLNGTTAGMVANRSVLYDSEGNEIEKYDKTLSSAGARKAAKFVSFCDAFSIPVISVVDVKGFKADKENEKSIASSAAELVFSFANATAPKISLIRGDAVGSAYLVMNSKSSGADIVYAWESAKIGMMDGNSAAKIMYSGEDASVIREQAKLYNSMQNSVETAAERGLVDTIIHPSETRKYFIGAIELLFSKRDFKPDKKHGTI